MPRLTLTLTMKLTMERLYETSGGEDWVNFMTGEALQSRGLVTVNTKTRLTAGGTFPAHMTKLTSTGKKWCERHFANIRRPGISPDSN